jgi:ArsR family transcriptional regulator
MTDIIRLLKALGDESRLRIFLLLAEAEDLCSCEIETILGLNQSNASRHLQKLREAGVLDHYKKAQWVHYRLSAACRLPLLRALAAEAGEDRQAMEDIRMLRDYRDRGFTCQNITGWVHPILDHTEKGVR